MSRYLLDVNVLIAMLDGDHVWHEAAHAWFDSVEDRAWATCPITENGLLRIVGARGYPNSPGTPAAVAAMVVQMRDLPGHQFWPDDLSLLSGEGVVLSRLLDAKQVTDTYLLALAKSRGGKLATFDRRLVTNAVRDGEEALHVIRWDL